MVSPALAGLEVARAFERLNGFPGLPRAVSLPSGATWYSLAKAPGSRSAKARKQASGKKCPIKKARVRVFGAEGRPQYTQKCGDFNTETRTTGPRDHGTTDN